MELQIMELIYAKNNQPTSNPVMNKETKLNISKIVNEEEPQNNYNNQKSGLQSDIKINDQKVRSKRYITKDKLQEIRSKIKKENSERKKDGCFQPLFITDEIVKKYELTPDFIEAQRYFNNNYKELSEKYNG